MLFNINATIWPYSKNTLPALVIKLEKIKKCLYLEHTHTHTHTLCRYTHWSRCYKKPPCNSIEPPWFSLPARFTWKYILLHDPILAWLVGFGRIYATLKSKNKEDVKRNPQGRTDIRALLLMSTGFYSLFTDLTNRHFSYTLQTKRKVWSNQKCVHQECC